MPRVICRLTFALAALICCFCPSLADGNAYPKLAPPLQPFIDNQTVPGFVALIATKDRILTEEAAGFCDVENKKPMHTDALCWVASLNKGMTAAALMMLVDEGKVSLDDPVEKYLPEFKPQWYIAEQDKDHMLLKHPQNKVLVRHLLTHMSGIPYSTGVEQPSLDMVRLQDRVYDYAATPLLCEPGTENHYSSAGINTAGRIIEVVSGMSYEDFMATRLFKPLGMNHATFRLTSKQVEHVPVMYDKNPGGQPWVSMHATKLHYPLDDPARQAAPGVGVFCTAEDIARFGQMLLNGGVSYDGHRVLSEAAVKTMTTKQTPDNIKSNYGLGLALDTTGYGHGGTGHSFLHVDTQHGLVSVIVMQLYNADEPRFGKFYSVYTKEALTYPTSQASSAGILKK